MFLEIYRLGAFLVSRFLRYEYKPGMFRHVTFLIYDVPSLVDCDSLFITWCNNFFSVQGGRKIEGTKGSFFGGEGGGYQKTGRGVTTGGGDAGAKEGRKSTQRRG